MAPAPAAAQDASADPPADPPGEAAAPAATGEATAQAGQIADIVVYAQKRTGPESVQDVPLAITAFGPTQLEALQAITIEDVGKAAPNVQLNQGGTFPNYATFTIRGIGNNASTRTIDPAVNVVVDGMVLGYQFNTIIDTFDLDGIEILRGPQGTLFGKNSTGGVVSVRTRRPPNHFQVRAEATIGNYNRRDFGLSIGGPLVDERLSAMLTVFTRNRDGYWTDRNGGTFLPAPLNPSGLQPPNPTGRTADVDQITIRPVIVLKPTSNFELILRGEYTRVDNGGNNTGAFIPDNGLPQPTTNFFGYIPPTGRFETNINLFGYTRIDDYRLILEANWDVGVGTITSVTGYRNVPRADSAVDIDSTPFTILNFISEESSEQFSEELRFASSLSDHFDFTVGVYYSDMNIFVREARDTFAPALQTVIQVRGFGEQESRSIAGFLNTNFRLTSTLSANLGARYTWEEKELVLSPIRPCSGPGFTGCPMDTQTFGRSWGSLTGRIGLQYEPNRDVLTYASWTRGARSGNINVRVTSFPEATPTNQETVDSLEAGLKLYMFNRRLRFNGAIYRMDYSNIQANSTVQTPSGFISLLTNAADGVVQGIEGELTVLPTPGLEINLGGGITDTRYTRLEGVDINRDGVINDLDTQAVPGLVFAVVPKYNATASITYTTEVPALGGTFSIRGAASYRSRIYDNITNRPDLVQDPFVTLDASLAFSRDNWRVRLWGRNLTNRLDIFTQTLIFNYMRIGGSPRTYGLEVGVEF